jgi:serine protease
VVDDGIRFDHPGIAANLTVDGYDFVANSSTVPFCAGGSTGRSGDGDGYDPDPTNPADYTLDPVLNCITGLKSSGNHGLHVAGTIGAVGNDGVGVTGVNWSVRIRPVRVFGVDGSSDYFDIAQGLLYAAGLPADDGAGGTVQASTGAQIINMSLGGPTPSTVLENAVISASSAGALMVASAGNDTSSVPNYPAAYPQTLSVSSVGPDGLYASYSSFGSTVDIAAPGGDLTDGSGDRSFGVMSTAWDYTTGTAIYDSWNGTSMAAPHVAGVAALLLAQDPSLTAADLRSRLTTYAVDVGAPGVDDFYGAGIVNARNSLTQSLAPPRDLYARLLDVATGAVIQTVAAQSGGAYSFTALADGDYYVFAGEDENFDGRIGIPGRRWGAFGGSATPTTVTVNGAGTYPATFTVGFPVELEPNDALLAADVLPVGGYLFGAISGSLTDADVSLVRIPTDGQYTFETSAVDGACGFALGEDTILELYDVSGTLLAQNDDIDVANLDFCSRITATLTAGTYYIAVWGWNGQPYRVEARQGL